MNQFLEFTFPMQMFDLTETVKKSIWQYEIQILPKGAQGPGSKNTLTLETPFL